MSEVFEGIRVLDFTRGMAGAIATMIMSDYGAEVIKVEPPGGDPFRSVPAARQWDRGKQSITLDLKSPEGRQQVQRLAQQTDVVIENFRPGVTQRLGIDYETLSTQRPDLVYCSITGWGPKGPYAHYKGYEGAVAAKSGRMMVFAGQANREGPHYSAVLSATHTANMAAVRGIIAALYVRNKTGQGQRVETSLLQGLFPFDFLDWIIWQMMVKFPERFPEHPWARGYRASMLAYIPARTKDGQWIQMANIVYRLFVAMMHAVDLGHVFDEPRFKKAPALLDKDMEALQEIMLERFQEKTMDEWMDLFIDKAGDVAAEPFMTAEQGMNHSQMLHNGHVQEVQDPQVGRMRQLGPLAMLYDTPGSIKGPAPAPGQHTQQVLGSLDGVQRPSYGSQPLPKYPLEGVTVLDLATVIAGPLACALLAELGARVIRIETPEGDLMRGMSEGIMANKTMAATEGMCLNLRTPEGVEIVRKLAAKADILVHNMRPGATERLGIGYEQLKEINPRLVYVYAGGYGPTGPHSHRPAMHPIPGAVCGGAVAQMGKGAIPPPDQPMSMDELREVSRRWGRANEGNPDPNSSMGISTAALLGFYARERTGQGQYVAPTMLHSNAYANADDFFWYEGKPSRVVPDADGYGLHALYRLYQARNGWVFLAAPYEDEWQALCQTIGRGDLLEDARFATQEARSEHDEELAGELAQVFATREPLEWEGLLTAADVTCVKAEEEAMLDFYCQDPHTQENGFIVGVETARLGKFQRYAPVLRFSHTGGKAGPGPLKGEQTATILQELGYTQAQVDDFKTRQVIDWEEP